MDAQIVELCVLWCHRSFKTVQGASFSSRQVLEIVFFCRLSGEALGSTQPPVYRALEAFSWGINGPEQDHKVTPSKVEVVHAWSSTTSLLHVFV